MTHRPHEQRPNFRDIKWASKHYREHRLAAAAHTTHIQGKTIILNTTPHHPYEQIKRTQHQHHRHNTDYRGWRPGQ